MTSYDEPTREEPPQIELEGIVGSTAYGLANEDSDVDKIGVFVEPTEAFLGLDGVPKSRQCWRPKGEEDRAVHEIAKYCSKVLAGNPTFTELLWLPSTLYTKVSWVGIELIVQRENMLSAKAIRDSYFGYATGQFRKLREKGVTKPRINKHARHMLRLLEQGYHAWSTGEILIEVKDPAATLAFGDLVAAGDLKLADEVLADYEAKFNNTKTVLPEQPNRKAVDAWLKGVRRDLLNQ